MGRSSRWLLGLIGVKKNSKSSKDGSSPSPTRKEEEKKAPKEKRRWSFGRAFTSSSKAEPQTPRSSAGNKIHEDNQHAVAVAAASAAAAEAAVAAAHAAAAVVRLTGGGILYGGTRLEELAAIKIQTAFRGYLARRALRALKAVVRIQALFRGHTVRKQAAITLRCMQALVRVQARVRARRVRMSEEGRAVQQHILRRRLEQQARPRKSVEGWNASSGTVEELQAKEERRQAAALKRERALAYAFSHQCQQKSGSNENSFSGNFDIDTPQWGWSWLERWMAARPWESPQVEDSKPGLECGSIERNSEGSARFLEMDLKKSRRTNRRSNLSSESLSAEANTFTSSSTAINTWPSSPGRSLQPVDTYSVPQIPTPVRSSRQSAVYTVDRHFNSSDARTTSNGLNGEFTAEDDDSFLSTAKSSPAFSTAGSRMTAKHNPFDSTRSEMADEFFYGHSAFPNYMAATQSAKAKKRSHSAPKQRPRTPERTPLSSRKRNSLSVSLSAMEVKSNSGRSRLQKQNSHVWLNRGMPGTYLIDRSSLRDSQSVISVNDDALRHFRF